MCLRFVRVNVSTARLYLHVHVFEIKCKVVYTVLFVILFSISVLLNIFLKSKVRSPQIYAEVYYNFKHTSIQIIL